MQDQIARQTGLSCFIQIDRQGLIDPLPPEQTRQTKARHTATYSAHTFGTQTVQYLPTYDQGVHTPYM